MKKSLKSKTVFIVTLAIGLFVAFSIAISYIFCFGNIFSIILPQKNLTQFDYFVIFCTIEVFIAGIVIAIVIAVVESTIIKPLRELNDAVSAIAYDDAGAGEKMSGDEINAKLKNLDIDSNDEIEALYHSIQKMQMDVNDYIISVKEDNWEAEHDRMTMLANSAKFDRRKKEVYPFVDSIYIACLDIINMRLVNANFSTNAGDSIISKVSRELRRISCDTIHTYRLHDDYFVMVLCGYSEDEATATIDKWNSRVGRLNRYTDSFDCRIVWGGSFGEKDFKVEEVYKRADAEMYCRKMIIKKEIGSIV